MAESDQGDGDVQPDERRVGIGVALEQRVPERMQHRRGEDESGGERIHVGSASIPPPRRDT
jgi:hypothetical protein